MGSIFWWHKYTKNEKSPNIIEFGDFIPQIQTFLSDDDVEIEQWLYYWINRNISRGVDDRQRG